MVAQRNASVHVMACSGATGSFEKLLMRTTDCQIGQNIDTGTLSVAKPTLTPASSRSRNGVISRCRSGGERVAGAQFIRPGAADGDIHAAGLEPVIAERRFPKPTTPRLHKGASGVLPAIFQFGLKTSVARIVSAPDRRASL